MPVADMLINMIVDLWKKELLINWKNYQGIEVHGVSGDYDLSVKVRADAQVKRN